MVKRRGLSDLLRSETQRLEQTDRETESQSLDQGMTARTSALHQEHLSVPEFSAAAPPDAVLTESVSSVETESVSIGPTESQSLSLVDPVLVSGPKYQQLVRKEARLHEAQYDELTRLARELNRRKRSAGETITANTLLRVAAELLLDRRALLRGDTEDELLASVQQRTLDSADR